MVTNSSHDSVELVMRAMAGNAWGGVAQQMRAGGVKTKKIALDSVSTGGLQPPNRKVLRDQVSPSYDWMEDTSLSHNRRLGGRTLS